MRILFLLAVLSLGTTRLWAQNVYVRAYGTATNPALLYLHGGPGFNAASFEVTTAQELADRGFYVIVYDRRGEGRSKTVPAGYTFAESLADIDTILDQHAISSIILLGHSFGGILATHYASQHPERTTAVVLLSAPIDLQASLRTILGRSRALYESSNDSTNLAYIGMLEQMDTASLDYATYLFAHAMQNDLYRPAVSTPAADSLYASIARDTSAQRAKNAPAYLAVQGFYAHERYTMLDLTEQITALHTQGTPVYGLYGMEDGLFDPQQLDHIESLLGTDYFLCMESASHFPYVDQHARFLTTLTAWLK
ncbi:2-succinyl-6-hydroxy-2, 4-cyclohexadiene-1-carboxylate synthase [Neolewinella maritima]|uniref:2-succinyl-6-hydroxy-2, 4-cyclohexadiene-1-carboxylate synthase n=1 Tax=Neolewinella maritima TaxID=1383882 RepID=A0ABM9B4A4_9BACT|nr:alpha/beta hydrolase [Neolewinella maritima]CAH1002168.1 2-succinyl-6-hydroxy-2, 4-cyclohexadiene-1-carboxylate synthase [Neolewinella maritima]